VTARVGVGGLALLLPESSGLIPAWVAEPDAAGLEKLAALAQDWTLQVLPAELAAEEPAAGRVSRLDEAVRRGRPVADAQLLPLDIAATEEKQATLYLVWPLARPAALLRPNDEATDDADRAAGA